MARYRKIDTRIWNDQRFATLFDDAKLVFLFLLTHPHLTSLGAMRATVPGLAAELGWTVERFQAAFNELVKLPVRGDSSFDDHALVEFDDRACFVGLPNFLKYNAPENPNVVKSWGELLDLVPECSHKARLLNRVREHVQRRGGEFVATWETVCQTVCQTLSERFPKPIGNGMPNPEPEPKPEQEPEPNHKGAAVAAGDVQPAKALKVKDTGKAQEPIPIPAELDTPEFAQAWSEWKEHLRQKRKPMKPLQEAKLLSTWAANGVERTIAAINHSIANGWQGLFEPNTPNNGQRPAAMSQNDPRGNFAALAEYRRMKAAAGIGGPEHDAQVD